MSAAIRPALSIVEDVSDSLLTRLSACRPGSPFLTPEYAAARRALGDRVIAFVDGDAAAPRDGALGFLRGRTWRSTLEITSVCVASEMDAFWRGVLAWCQSNRVALVELSSFASDGAVLPAWPGLRSQSARCEWLLDLASRPAAPPSSNHRRNLAKARKAGVSFERGGGREALDVHLALMIASTERREARGESVGHADAMMARELGALLDAGCAEIVRAVQDGTVLSSLLLLHAPHASYYQSAGTSPTGMELGSSVFLVQSTIEALAADGRRWFNLAGAGDENPGLQRFKAGFGAVRRDLVAAVHDVRPVALRKLRTTALLVRSPRTLVRMLVAIDTLVVHAIDPARRATDPIDGELRALDDVALRELAARTPEFSVQWTRREQSGFNAAFAYLEQGEVQHVAWLIESRDDARQRERNVSLRPGEAEITHCVTPVSARGRGVYPRVIGLLLAEAERRGLRRVFMITNITNTASRRGIEKAGLPRVGTIRIVTLFSGLVRLRLRGHRLPWR